MSASKWFHQDPELIVQLVNSDGFRKVTYTELVPEIANEPNYEAALAALKG